VQYGKKKCVLLAGFGAPLEGLADKYARQDFTVLKCAVSQLDQYSDESIDLLHILPSARHSLDLFQPFVAHHRSAVAIPFSPDIKRALLEQFVINCEASARPLMLAYAPLYYPSFSKLKHAVQTGIVGDIREVRIRLPGGCRDLPEPDSALSAESPVTMGLTWAASLTSGPWHWERLREDDWLARGDNKRQCLLLTGSQEDSHLMLEVEGTGSLLRLSIQGERHTLLAVRGNVSRVIAQFDVLPECALVKAAQLFLDGRTRTVVGGHNGLYLNQLFTGFKRARHDAAAILENTQEEAATQLVAGDPPPLYERYRKLPMLKPGKPLGNPFWEAKMNIERICNQDCVFCFAREGELVTVPEDNLIEILGRLTAEGVEGIMFSGREPTLNKRLPELISEARKAGLKNITVETNALLFDTMEFVIQCKEAGLHASFVSFHSVREQTVEQITQTPGSLRRTLRGIRNLLEQGIEVELNCVMNRFNYHELEEIADWVTTNLTTISSLTFSFVAPLGRAEGNRAVVPRIAQVTPYLRKALLLAEKRGLTALVPGRCGIPLCTLPGMERFFVDYTLRDHITFNTAPLPDDRLKTPLCSSCRFNLYCHGLWSNYAALYSHVEIDNGFALVNSKTRINTAELRHD
jgi:MoaA/NifB/PqqE/SkfB family radical SAM enzyme